MTEPATTPIEALCFGCNKGKKKGETIKTQVLEPEISMSKNGRRQASGKCSVCKGKVRSFIKKEAEVNAGTLPSPDSSSEDKVDQPSN